jgi:peptide/nickel transport system ATP-binding protein
MNAAAPAATSGATSAKADRPILEVTGLGLDFWVDGVWYPAAIDMTYDVKPGEVLAIVGESGSGKSSSSMAILGLTPENGRVTGSIKLGGTEISHLTGSRLRAVRGRTSRSSSRSR